MRFKTTRGPGVQLVENSDFHNSVCTSIWFGWEGELAHCIIVDLQPVSRKKLTRPSRASVSGRALSAKPNPSTDGIMKSGFFHRFDPRTSACIKTHLKHLGCSCIWFAWKAKLRKAPGWEGLNLKAARISTGAPGFSRVLRILGLEGNNSRFWVWGALEGF